MNRALEPALTVFVTGPQLINNGCAVMRNLGKPLRDSERYPHVRRQAGSQTDRDRRDNAGSRDGLRSARSNLGKANSHTLPPPIHPRHFHDQGIPADLWLFSRSLLAKVLSLPATLMILAEVLLLISLFFSLNLAGQDDGGFALF